MRKKSTPRIIILDRMVSGKSTFVAALSAVLVTLALLAIGGNSVAAQNRIAVGPPQNVAFHSQRDGNYEIYVMNPDGTGQTRITNDPATDQYPDISPNGQHIAFISNRTTADNPTGDAEVFVMNADGSEVTQLTFDTAVEAWPRWSPNGHTIAFHSNVDGDYEIYTIESDGSNLTRVTYRAGLDQWPDWSPNGKQLVIRRDNDIYVINTDGSDPVRLTASAQFNQMAVYSPNGKQLAFMSFREGYCSVFTMDADGENQINLTPKTPGDVNSDWCSRGPTWSTNGRQIYFTSKRPPNGSNFELYVMNSDGSDVTRLTFVAGEDGMPSVR